MREYESTYIIDGGLPEEEVEGIMEQYDQEVKKQGGEVVNKNCWGKRKFTYNLKGKSEGYYVTMNFKSLPAVAKELERQLKLNDKIVREMMIRNN